MDIGLGVDGGDEISELIDGHRTTLRQAGRTTTNRGPTRGSPLRTLSFGSPDHGGRHPAPGGPGPVDMGRMAGVRRAAQLRSASCRRWKMIITPSESEEPATAAELGDSAAMVVARLGTAPDTGANGTSGRLGSGRALRVEPGVAGRDQRRLPALGVVVGMVVRWPGRAAPGAGRNRRVRRRMAGREPPLDGHPGVGPGRGGGLDPGQRGGRDPRPPLLQHGLGCLQPGRGPAPDARDRSLHRHTRVVGQPAEGPGAILDLHGERRPRGPRLLSGRLDPPPDAGPGPRVPPRGRRLDGPVGVDRHRGDHLRSPPDLDPMDRAAPPPGSRLHRGVQLGGHRCRLPALPGAGRLALGPIRPRPVRRCRPVDGPGGPRPRLFDQADPVVLRPLHRPGARPRGTEVRPEPGADGGAVPGHRRRRVRRREPPLRHLVPGRLGPGDLPPLPANL